MFGRQPSIIGHIFLWARDRMRGNFMFTWYRIQWQKIGTRLSSVENTTSVSNPCSTSPGPQWHWLKSLLWIHGLWCRCFTNGIRCRVWGAMLMRLLADTSKLGIECSSTHNLMNCSAISLEEFNITVWRSPGRLVYKITPHIIYEVCTSVTQ